MKKRISTRVICLLVALAMLAGALMVSAINGSPYETLKNAAFDALFFDNVTIEGDLVLRIDGDVEHRAQIHSYIGEDSSLTMDSTESPNLGQSWNGMTYNTSNLAFNMSTVTQDGVQWYSVRRQFNAHSGNSPGYDLFGPQGRDSNQLRLVELLIDLFVGDLKNNFTISSHGSDMRRVSGAITESQLPEIVRVIIDIALDGMSAWEDQNSTRQREDFLHVLEIPIRGVTINRISGNADIDSDGNLRYVNVVGMATIVNIFDDTHVIEGEMTFRFYDIGTTVPVSPFPGAADLFTEELFREIAGRPSGMLYFTRDASGNIDIDSITDRWPSRTVTTRSSTLTLSYPTNTNSFSLGR